MKVGAQVYAEELEPGTPEARMRALDHMGIKFTTKVFPGVQGVAIIVAEADVPAALDALGLRAAAPVPREPTAAMLAAAECLPDVKTVNDVLVLHQVRTGHQLAGLNNRLDVSIWKAMYDAAPQPAATEAVAWREYAEHLEWCRTCAEDGVDSCFDARLLRSNTRATPSDTEGGA